MFNLQNLMSFRINNIFQSLISVLSFVHTRIIVKECICFNVASIKRNTGNAFVWTGQQMNQFKFNNMTAFAFLSILKVLFYILRFIEMALNFINLISLKWFFWYYRLAPWRLLQSKSCVEFDCLWRIKFCKILNQKLQIRVFTLDWISINLID